MAEQVDFYILGSTGRKNRFQYACRLALKAYQHGVRVFVRADGEQAGDELDQMLWTFSQGSFIPHARADRAAGNWEDFPVQVGWNLPAGEEEGLLISLVDDAEIGNTGFNRIAEIVSADEDVKDAARDRYRQYREQGMEPATHNVD